MSAEDDIFAEGICSATMGQNHIPSKFSSINRSLKIMDIKGAVDQSCLVFFSPGHQSRTSWHIANTASSRTKALASELSADAVFRDNLVKELREIFSTSQLEFDCNILLSPLLTKDSSISDELDDLINEEDQSDVLMLFGSPASAFQLFLSVPCLQPALLDLLLEVVLSGSNYSLQLISQLLRPVGISTFFTTFTSLEEVVGRLIELIKSVDGQTTKTHILQVLPELLASPVENPQTDLNSEVVSNTIQKIIELLDYAIFSRSEDQANHTLVTEIIECANHFPLEGFSLNRLKDACKDVIIRSAGKLSNRKCIADVIRSLFASELKKCFSLEEICEFVSLLRSKMRLSEITIKSDQEILLFLDTLSLVFRSNSQLKLEWLSYLHRGYSNGGVDCGLLIDDLLILLLVYDSEMALGGKFGSATLNKRKEYSLILKTFNFVAERITNREIHESFSKYSAIFQHKQLCGPLLTLTNHLMKTCQSPSSLPGTEQPKRVITDLCKNIYSSLTSVSIFEKKRMVRNSKLTINLLLQLSTMFAEKMSPFYDQLLGLLEEVSKRAEESPPDLIDIRKLFAIPAKIAFGGTGETYLQDDLLISIRRLLLNCSSKLRAIGLIGAVTVLEMLCKRLRRSKSLGPVNSTPCSQAEVMECSQSSVLASQVAIPLASQTTASQNTTSRSSHSHLSLKGPGTSLADDSEEVNLPADSVDLDSDPKSASSYLAFLPQPSRLMLQLVGLVENALRRSSLLFSQLKVFWYDELATMFARLEAGCQRPLLSPESEMKRFIDWMGSRVMREFQEEFVVDNAGNRDCTIQLGLNDAEICEIALNLGPTFARHTEATVALAARPPLSSVAHEHITRKPSAANAPFNRSAPASPALVPAHLRLLAVVETFKSNRCLDSMNALLGCPILLPTVSLNDLPPSIIIIIINCCIEAVNTFAEAIVFPSSRHSHPRRLLSHPLASTLICRLIQIASLRCCLHAVLLRRVKNAALTASAAEVPSPIYEAIDTMTFDPTFVYVAAGHPISAKRFPIFMPSGGKKSTVSKCRKRPSREAKGRPRKRVCTKSLLDATEHDENEDGGAATVYDEDEEEEENGEGANPTTMGLEGGEVLEQTAAVNRLAGVNGSGKSNALLSDKGEKRLVSDIAVGRRSSPRRCYQFDDRAITEDFIKYASLHMPTNLGCRTGPLLPSLTVCFRELDLSTILLGLQSPLQQPADFCWTDESSLPDSPVDAAVDVIYDVSGVKHFGRKKSPDTPLNWITVCYLLNELKLKVDHVFGVDLKSSAGWYAFERLDAMSPQLRHSYLLAVVPRLVRIVNSLTRHFKECRDEDCENDPFGLSRLSFTPSTRILADCLSTSLYCITALSTGILPVVSALRSPDTLLSKTSPPSDATCLSRLRRLAQCLDNLDVSESSLFDSYHLPTVSMLEDDVLGLATDPSNQPEAENEKPSAAEVLRIIQWLMDFSPQGLAHTPSAFIHACFVLSLARHLNIHVPATESAINEHSNLLDYTHSLMSMAWETTAGWKACSHKDCLGTLIALHLYSPFFGPSPSPLNECLEVLINLIKFNLLPLLQGRGRDNGDITRQGRLCYSGLTTQSSGLYGRKVLEAFCFCVRKLAKKTIATAGSRSVDLLNQWSACLGVLVCITEATKSDTPSRAFFDLLPYLMRAGRMFVEHLLRGAMPFLNAMFRSHGSEVLKFLRSVQQVTRFLQRICVHAKTRREARLTPLIPQTRKCLEAFVYSVKAYIGDDVAAREGCFLCMPRCVKTRHRRAAKATNTSNPKSSIMIGDESRTVTTITSIEMHPRGLILLLAQNHCADAFWLGNLKNRDLAGQEIHDTDVSTRHSSGTTLSTASPHSSRGGNSKDSSYTVEGAEDLISEDESEVEEEELPIEDSEEEDKDEN
ncbi:Fanconi anemia group D2 protein [Echinococcus granulosus]|uniref:Fanconi anemia group D2 protein n=1 Tax=Echinococcus granulosus TaxID=6210 RepID=W6UF04_ECHGR|nr:Fanconi anemia group D2 protein [Echinococcus granulosus]EUB59688.1 Fanconi anemia group D2 protein [Echinococcus granulosus]